MPYEKPEPGQPIMVRIGGRELELLFTLGTLKELDRTTHISALRSEQMGAAIQSPAQLGAVLYYGLREKQPDITQEWIDANITAPMILELVPVVGFALTGRWPGDEKKAAQSPNGHSPEAGSTSGQSDDTTLAAPSPSSGA